MRPLPIIVFFCILAAAGALAMRWSGASVSTFAPRRDRRFWACVGTAFFLHLMLIAPSIVQIGGCRHETPLGIPGGSGDKIAKGAPQGKLGGTGDAANRTAEIRARTISQSAPRRRPERGRDLYMARKSGDGLLQLLKARPETETGADSIASTLDNVSAGGEAGPLGLPQGQGTGPTAAGSPHGTKIGGPLYLYRIKHGGDWAANPRALPSLLREVHLTMNIKPANSQETLTLSDLAHHRGAYFPMLVFMTGTGPIRATEIERANLRKYLLDGGMLIADSSGGSFEQGFAQFIADVLPGRRLRPIEHDHEVYRGAARYYKLPRGCPVYRDHGSSDAKGIFADDGRLMVFFSPGDLGSAWAVVDLGQKRGAVEQAFQMGANLVNYALWKYNPPKN